MRGLTSGSAEEPLAVAEASGALLAPGVAAASAMTRVWRYRVKGAAKAGAQGTGPEPAAGARRFDPRGGRQAAPPDASARPPYGAACASSGATAPRRARARAVPPYLRHRPARVISGRSTRYFGTTAIASAGTSSSN